MSYAHLSPVYPTSSSYPTEYRTEPGEPTLPFNEEQIIADLVSQDGVSIRPEISCKIEKGFFYSQEHAWTCYRRNYFSVSCSYSLEPQIDCGVLYIKRKNENTDTPEMKPIQALAVNLSASVDGSNGKIVDLVQHTPKRDKGPQLKVTHTKLYPSHKSTSHTTSGAIGSFPPASYGYHTAATPLTNSLHLPLQHLTTQTRETHEAQSAGISFPTPTATAHTFERIQFKNATANNGKRRAQQQYYHLIVELFADVRTDSSAPEEWVKVAQRVSQQVVVRGRSPSHYKNEGPTSNSRTSTSGSLSGRQNAWSPFQGHSSQMYVSSTNGRMLPEPGNYMYHAMPSITEPAASIGHHMINNSAISALEPPRALTANISNGRALFTSHAGPGAAEEEGGGYSYYPQPLYEAGLTTSSGSMMKSDEMTHSGKSSSSPESAAGTFSQPMPGKYAGYETSKGYYPS
jgi:meiosis-specific transcription factor NDT80